MRTNLLIIVIVTVCLINVLNLKASETEKADDAGQNYLQIRKMYNRWDNGPGGSSGYYRNQLYNLLVDKIGKNFKSDFDYISDFYDEKEHQSKIISGKWLVLFGDISPEDIKKSKDLSRHHGKFNLNKYGLFSISGKIKKFRLSDFSDKKIVYLYLENIKIHHFADESIKK